MSPVSHQTIKLSKGKHRSPEEGACVMELASMLAGECFTDHPASVCPVIASLMRAYNDTVEDDFRQDLYAYAATTVGSRASSAVQQARAERVVEWTAEVARRRRTWMLLPSSLHALGRRRPSIEATGSRAVRAIGKHSEETHRAVLALIDELIALSGPARPSIPARPAATRGHRRVTADSSA
jgi:hypothetical protein